MNIFIDTAAFLAVLNANDRFHQPARQTWNELLASDSILLSSNYVILETIALLQHRFGIEAVRLFESDILPIIEIIWADETIHRQGMSAILVANRRDLSLVDCTGFEIMRQNGLDTVFTFDPHFGEQGFKAISQGLYPETIRKEGF
jgi:predicted nucleic acid-binding protein